MPNKKIGILTMHKVLNYGSALQAYALQQYISSMGHNVELIDYIFPNGKRKSSGNLKAEITSSMAKAMVFLPLKRKKRRFQAFYDSYFNCTNTRFNSPESINKFEPDYDIIMTGSDQVWNPKHIKDDLSFFLPFAGESVKKLSYASSFSTATIPENLSDVFKKHLMRYDRISVREKSGVEIVRKLISKDADFVCDPTLLLTRENWNCLADKADNMNRLPKCGYILIYLLRYAYDPYPVVKKIIDKVQKELQLPLVILDPSITENNFKNAISVRDAGPLEFLNLVRNASYVITSSFHGTAFSLNFEVPFYSVIKERERFDTRMVDLLDRVGADRDVVYNNDKLDKPLVMDYTIVSKGVKDFRNQSKNYLREILQ